MFWRDGNARSRRSEDGAGLVEYVLLPTLIAVVCIAAIGYSGTTVDDRFSTVGSTIGATTGP